ncbi:Elongator subunit elp2 [Ranunculus cassubicifolius]
MERERERINFDLIFNRFCCELVSAQRVFIGAGCNRIVNNVSWGASGLIAFGAQNAVAIFCPKTAQILTTLPGHKASVNCTQWIPSTKDAFKGTMCISLRHFVKHFDTVSGSAQRVFIGAGCNRIVNNVSWGASGLIAFGAQNAVAIFCPKTAQILTTLPGHKASVNCTQWIPSTKDAFKVRHLQNHYLLSGDANGVIIVWELSLTDGKWRIVLQLPKTHRKGVTCISGIVELLLPSADGGGCEVSCLESFSLGAKPMVALSLAELPGNDGSLVLAMGGLDNKVHIYCGEQTGKFIHSCELKGHTDWIRSLDFSLPSSGEKDSLLLVSSSQDRCIRLWKIALRSSQANSDMPYRIEDIGLASYIEGPIIVAGSLSYQISLESLLIGHEDWVYSVQWQPPSNEGNDVYQPQSILSASMDKTMMIWQPEKTTGIWMNVVTVGELSHCALGFYGGHWSSASKWSGHFAAVTDIAWSRSCDYLLSVSHDQTTRIFAPWKDEDCNEEVHSWHEIACPQVHGHDINCVTLIQGKGNHRFVSGADEKVARVFEAPLSFLKTLGHARLKNSSVHDELQSDIQVLGANMSALGLSQKPIYVQAPSESQQKPSNDELDTLGAIPDAVPSVFTKPPIEEQLAFNTLWPESHKLYGHGNELFSLCCNHQGQLVASSCKAQSATAAEIWLWQVGTWKAVGRLPAHNLTVTNMQFSYDDSFLLAVSRDRQFSLFSIKGVDEISYELISRQEAHKRIIWTCSWNPCAHEFATGSRDKSVKIWAVINRCSVKQVITLPDVNY